MTDNSPTQTEPVIDPSLVNRVKNLLTRPKDEWTVIDIEFATTRSLFTRYAMILAAIGPVATLIGGQLLPIAGFKLSFFGALLIAILTYVLSLVAVYLIGLVISALASGFGGEPNKDQAMKLSVYAWTAAWLAGIFGLVPALSVLGVVGLYSFYLLYVGLPKMMKVPEGKVMPYFLVTVLVGLGVYLAMSMIIGAVSLPFVISQAFG